MVQFPRAHLSSKQRHDIDEAYSILGVAEDISNDEYTLNKFIERKKTIIKSLAEKEHMPQMIKEGLIKLINDNDHE